MTSTAGSSTLAITAVDSGGIALAENRERLVGGRGAIDVERAAHQGAGAPAEQDADGPPRTPTSIPMSEPLAVPTRPTLSALSGMRSSPVAVRSTTAADSRPMRPLGVALLQHAQRLVGLARLRPPDDV